MTEHTAKDNLADDLECIRLRPRMFIGRLGNGSHPEDGIYVLLKEVLDNAIDEFISGKGKKIEVTINPEGEVAVRDYGQGIRFDKLERCATHIGPSIKRYDRDFYFSVGLEGAGLKLATALSSAAEVVSYRDGQFLSLTFAGGQLVVKNQGTTSESDGVLVRYMPDQTIFTGFAFRPKFVRKRLWRCACLNPGLEIHHNSELFHSSSGLPDLLRKERRDLFWLPFYYEGKDGGSVLEWRQILSQIYEPIHCKSPTLEFAFYHAERPGEACFSFINGSHTNEGDRPVRNAGNGHLAAFREGMLKAINKYSGRKFVADNLCYGLVAALNVRISDVNEELFCYKERELSGNPKTQSRIIDHVCKELLKHLKRNPAQAKALIDKIQKNTQV